MDTTKAITHLSLCSGYEGIGLGLRRVLPTLREIAYVEREGFPIANLVAKMEAGELDAAPVFTDVKTFPYRKFRGIVDILSGGFPCQPFSAAGKRQATEDPRHLFPYIADGIRECQPRIVFLENVQGILSCKTGDGEPVLQYVLRTLEGLGYRATAGIFSAEEVGAPHQRKRVFILGMVNSDSRRCSPSEQPRSSSEEISGGQINIEPSSGSQELANSECGGLRGGRSSQECRDDSKWIQSNEGERNELRSEVKGCSNSSREELGNASDLRCKQPSADSRETGTNQSGEERRMYESQGASSLSRYGSQQNCSPELANGISAGLEGHSGNEQGEGRQSIRQGRPTTASGLPPRWPSRPGEAQQEWEEPRVVGNTQNISCDVGNDNGELGQSECGEPGGAAGKTINRGEAKPQLGRASNGSTRGVDATANRVDRLRLLGNGVVNQTAAKAFVTLINRLT